MTVKIRVCHGTASLAALLATTVSAHAVCMSQNSSLGVGLPSISATEVSSWQVAEMVRHRQEVEQSSLILAGTGAAGPEATPAASPAPSATKTAVQKKSLPSTAKPDTDTAPSAVAKYNAGNGGPTHGVWAQGYADYEHRSDLTIDVANPGAISRNSYSSGFLAGADTTFRLGDPRTRLTTGIFGGYNATHSRESDGTFRDFQGFTPPEAFKRSAAEQNVDGGFVGGYLTLLRDRFALQTIFKADIYRLDQRDTVMAFNPADPFGCAFPAVTRSGTADLNNYIVEANASYRFDAGARSAIEPIIGVRVTFTNFSNQNGSLPVPGDGHVVRLQGGARYSTFWTVPGGVLTTSLTGLLYSDVAIDGFATVSGGFQPTTPIPDEGKLRVLGQILTRWDQGDGLSYTAQAEVRGGENLFGVGGLLGLRYEW